MPTKGYGTVSCASPAFGGHGTSVIGTVGASSSAMGQARGLRVERLAHPPARGVYQPKPVCGRAPGEARRPPLASRRPGLRWPHRHSRSPRLQSDEVARRHGDCRCGRWPRRQHESVGRVAPSWPITLCGRHDDAAASHEERSARIRICGPRVSMGPGRLCSGGLASAPDVGVGGTRSALGGH